MFLARFEARLALWVKLIATLPDVTPRDIALFEAAANISIVKELEVWHPHISPYIYRLMCITCIDMIDVNVYVYLYVCMCGIAGGMNGMAKGLMRTTNYVKGGFRSGEQPSSEVRKTGSEAVWV